MGNITSESGNNYINGDPNNQTPLNKFIEKVMNEEYFFTPNVSDDMISKLKENEELKNDETNKNVLLKRALCTGTTFVPISLPHVTCRDDDSTRCETGIYTVNINATGDAGEFGGLNTKLPNIETMGVEDYARAEENARRVLEGTASIDSFMSQSPEDINTRDVLLYKQIVTRFQDSNRNKYDFTVSTSETATAGIGTRLGQTDGCKIFYRGKASGDINYNAAHDPREFNSTNASTGLSNTKSFCGKVFQYNDFSKKINNSLNNQFGDDTIGRFTNEKRGSGNNFRKDEFVDCACLNSILAVERDNIINIAEEARRLARERGETVNVDAGEDVTPQKLAQSNDTYCKNNLSDFDESAPGAYASENLRAEKPLNICSSFVQLSGVDQTGGDLDAGTDCGFKESDLEKLKKCQENPNAPGCNLQNNNNTPDDDKNNTGVIVAVVVILLIAGAAAYYFLVLKKKPSVETPLITSNIKYTKPTSDPLYRELK